MYSAAKVGLKSAPYIPSISTIYVENNTHLSIMGVPYHTAAIDMPYHIYVEHTLYTVSFSSPVIGVPYMLSNHLYYAITVGPYHSAAVDITHHLYIEQTLIYHSFLHHHN